MQPIFEQIRNIGLVPVIRLDDPSKAVPLARALKAGGIPTAEITFRAAGAERAIAAVAQAEPDVLLGAGTVLTVEQVKQAIDAGARYILCPDFDPAVVGYCLEHEIPVLPGCSTPSEVGQAVRLGLQAVKFFPAETAGGVAALRALAGPFGQMKFLPTGGINEKNLCDYLALEQVLACGGSWMVPQSLLDAEDWDGVTALARAAVRAMLQPSFAHLGVNSADTAAARQTRDDFADLYLETPERDTDVSVFVGAFEVMKAPGRGAHGHLALCVNDVDRAERYYRALGYAFDEETRRRDEKGRTTFLYLDDPVGGFAVHLLRR